MKFTTIRIFVLSLLLAPLLNAVEEALSPEQQANTIALDEVAIKNLNLKTVIAEERDFENTVFAIGRVEEVPGAQSTVSARIPGRATSVKVIVGDPVEAGQTLVTVESRQPGDPPPIIELKALQSGVITASHVTPGQPVQPEAELLHISDRSKLWVVARIPEQRASGIEVGTPARIRFPASDKADIKAKLIRFGIVADREAGAIEGIFEVDNSTAKLFPGMRAELDIIVSTRPQVLAVPESAVQGDPASRVVYVRDFELPNAFIKCPVVLGARGGGWIEVKQGIFPGDEVVTSGSYLLSFIGGGGLSLKQALDAAHGHAHNEDGSELTEDEEASHDHDHGKDEDHESDASAPSWLIYYAGGSTLLALLFLQLWWNLKCKKIHDA